MNTKLAQLRANKSPLLESYLHTVNPDTYTTMATALDIHTYTLMTLITFLAAAKHQHNTTPPVNEKSL